MDTSHHYVYVIQSQKDVTAFYTGYTTDLQARFDRHNNGESLHTSHLRPWKLVVAIAFPDKYKALRFETYLKSHSGRAFMTKHF